MSRPKAAQPVRQLNTIHQEDCVRGMQSLPAESVDLAFADPPFNIGYEYDVYADRLESDEYLAWSREWMGEVHRVLKPHGTFWLAIGDEYAAELKIESQKLGFHCRSWVIWYYTFGVNCARKFSRSHAHLFHFVKDRDNFTFRSELPENRIPSARQLVYNDKRANPQGRLPDDTWILRPEQAGGALTADEPQELISPPEDSDRTWTLRPQELEMRFSQGEDTWYFPRVAGTFKERAGFHGCQMPEQLLGRIIRLCSEPGDLVLDPFSGSATTLAVAKKLNRNYIGFELSESYAQAGRQRLEGIRVGDPLDGAEEPTIGDPSTRKQTMKALRGPRQETVSHSAARKPRTCGVPTAQVQLTLDGVLEAFQETHRGYSADRVVVDPELNRDFAEACAGSGIPGDRRIWNSVLFRLRKSGELAAIPTPQITRLSWEQCDAFLYAAEMALEQILAEDRAGSLDEILCDPILAADFDARVARFAPGFPVWQPRWAALKLRKQSKRARAWGAVYKAPAKLGRRYSLDDLAQGGLSPTSGAYLLTDARNRKLYVGETLNLGQRLHLQFGGERRDIWEKQFPDLGVQVFPTETSPSNMLAWQSCLATRYRTIMNYRELLGRG